MVKKINSTKKLQTAIKKTKSKGKVSIKKVKNKFKTNISKVPETLGFNKKIGVML